MKKICNYCECEYDGWQSEHSKCIDRYNGPYPLFVEVPDDTFDKWEQLAVKKCPICNNGMSSPPKQWICYHKDCTFSPIVGECYQESRPEKRHDYHWNQEKQKWICTTIDCKECKNNEQG